MAEPKRGAAPGGGADSAESSFAAAPPASGFADEGGHRHVFAIRVYYEDTDAEGIVYYANYLKFAERARTEMLRLMGREQFQMMAEDGIGFAVRQCLADYFLPARLDDVLTVFSTVTEVGGASLRLQQDICRGGDLVARLKVRLAVMNRQGRPVRLPQDIREALEPHVLETAPQTPRPASPAAPSSRSS